jgi:hypothetical protein
MFGVASIAVLDLLGVVMMVVTPDLTERVIPALVGVQIFGFVAIAFIVVMGRKEDIATEKANIQDEGIGKQWVPWLFGFLALLSFLRAGFSILYIAGETWHRYSCVAPITRAGMGCFFLWLAVVASHSATKRESKEETSSQNPRA